MKKAKIVLTLIILCGLVGGALAFNAKKFTNTFFLVYTSAYTYTNGVVYVLPGSYCVRPSIYFVTVSGGVISTGYYSTVIPYSGVVTGTAAGGATIALTYYICNGLPFGATRVTTIS